MNDIWDDFRPESWLEWLALSLLVLLVAGLPCLIWYAIQDEKAWEKYAPAHHCRSIGHFTTLQPMLIGKVTTFMVIPHTVYMCDGQEVVTR